MLHHERPNDHSRETLFRATPLDERRFEVVTPSGVRLVLEREGSPGTDRRDAVGAPSC
jgi:hypothetical protein